MFSPQDKKKKMLLKETRCIKSRGVKTFEQYEDVQMFLILLKYIFFYIYTWRSEATDLHVSQKTN